MANFEVTLFGKKKIFFLFIYIGVFDIYNSYSDSFKRQMMTTDHCPCLTGLE